MLAAKQKTPPKTIGLNLDIPPKVKVGMANNIMIMGDGFAILK